ncbi:hypothetical protein KAFR_0K00310 [Kazachstania africana CBS 2517]|uniref:GP-PDE domain-containing protein n=1 Tax=Kazachstania africana (strain ATCC 22294 / BCRC 22015 / CBS 2517 / CECT 1963 / NBRC 1671 / NRRL Y-8276) TaxID=1071382 RepID=H2B186_KAZAF|nr:hypothetical protein KAFR_0K00310 [Kazachstania africana CBS 2517]CCF60386.1 hypothetical protein KAFR_0K00310 [Kazachstania africana CBS 2517]
MVKIVGHRAFKGSCPENSLKAFNMAYDNGVDMLETDLQLTKDGEIIINHDSDTGRNWDQDLVIAESNYEDLLKLKHKLLPDEKILTFNDLLTWFIGRIDQDDTPHDCKLMLDIKFTNDKLILVKIFNEMLKVRDDLQFWQSRIVLGVWLLDWYQYGVETAVFKGFDIIVITMSLDVAEQFINYSIKLDDPDFKLYGISIHYVSSWTDNFRYVLCPIIEKYDIKVFLWTVNKEIDFSYIEGLPIYGTITDNPLDARAYLKDKHHWATTTDEKHKFNVPQLNSLEGLRFHSYIVIYDVVCALLFSKWAHFKIFGYSVAYIIFLMLRVIHFL